MRDFYALAFMLGACFLVGCSPLAGSWVFKEAKRIKSPDGQAEAIILTGEAGATTSTETFILIAGVGGRVVDKNVFKDAVFQADHLKNFNAVWKEPGLLEIQYEEARIDHFRNQWIIVEGRDKSYPVEIRLRPTSLTFSVPLRDRTPFTSQ